MCITDGQFILDNFCTSGNWTTRTKLVALELLNYAQNKIQPINYTLFCDEPRAATVNLTYSNVLDYVLGPSAAIGIDPNALRSCFTGSGFPCVNNVCVLSYATQSGDKGKALGVSLNKEISGASSFLKALNFPEQYCNALQGNGRYRKCSGDDKIWFNSSLNSVIYSKDGVDLDPTTSFETIGNWFGNLYYGLINWFLGMPAPANVAEDYSYTTNTSRFNKLYIDYRQGKKIYGFQEQIAVNTFMLINYKGFQTNICTYVNNRLTVQGTGSLPVGVVCTVIAPRNTVVYTNDAVAAELWPDFTSALRVS